MKNFCIDIVIDLHPPGSIDPESGGDVLKCAAAAAGSARSWLGDAAIASHGFPFGKRDCKAVDKYMEHLSDDPTSSAGKMCAEFHRFDVPPFRPTAAEMSADAIRLPQQSKADIRVLAVVRVSIEMPLGHTGDELFRMACELKDKVLESSKNAPHMTVHRVDVAPEMAEDEETMQRFLDSLIDPDHR